MNVEQTLTDELEMVARSVDTPPPPAVAALVQEARSARGRSRVRWAATTFAAAAVIAAVVAGTQLGQPDAAPQPTRPTESADALPVGKPLRTYVDPTTDALYIDGEAVRGNGWDSAETFGDLTLGYLGAQDSGYVGIFLGAQRVGTLHPDEANGVLVAPGGRTIAWVELKDGSGAVVVARVGTDGLRELGRLPVAALTFDVDNESRQHLIAVDDAGTVTYGSAVGGHAWRPGNEPTDVDISAAQGGPAGFPGRADDVHLNRAGTWGAWLTSPRDPGAGGGEASWSAITFQQPNRPDTKASITMPDRLNDVRDFSWESDTDIVLTIYTGNLFVHEVLEHVRCNVIDRACEVAPGLGDH